MTKYISSDTTVFGYLLPEGVRTSRVELYARFLSSDPSATIVPLHARETYLESAIHNVRTGLVRGYCIDPAFYMMVEPYVDVISQEAAVANVVDTVSVDPKTGAVVGDCMGVAAFRSVTSRFLSGVKDPIALLYGSDWEVRIGMTAMSGMMTLMKVNSPGNPELDSIGTGCVVEYNESGEAIDSEPFDILVNPPDRVGTLGHQFSIGMSCGKDTSIGPAGFEALRLAYTVGKFMGLHGGDEGKVAAEYAKKMNDSI